MIRIRKSTDRGRAELGWLHSWHSFSFSDYYDPQHMGYSVLRVINDDALEPSRGFGTHPHKNMEIISIVLEGALKHKDSMGNGSIILPGEVQRMSAGTGVTHSEFNPSNSEHTHFLQIWILPDQDGHIPSYAQMALPTNLSGNFRLVASPDGGQKSLCMNQDARLHIARLDASTPAITQKISMERKTYVHLAQGHLYLNDIAMHAGDGAYIDQENELTFEHADAAYVLLFDLP